MDLRLISGVGGFLGGAVTAALFRRPGLNVAGAINVIAGGTAGAAISLATLATTGFVIQCAEKQISQMNKQRQTITIIFGLVLTSLASGAIYTLGARALINRCTSLAISYKEVFSFIAITFISNLVLAITNGE